MAFWKELGVAALDKSKSFLRGGKEALSATKNAESFVKGAKVVPLGVEKGKVSVSPITRGGNYLSWEKSLPKANFAPSFNGRWARFKYSLKDNWNGFWKSSPKEAPPKIPKATPSLSFTDRMKNWFHRFTPRPAVKEPSAQLASPVKPTRSPIFKDSGYLSWENTLPKFSFKPHFNPITKSKEAVKGKKEAVEEAAKVEKKIVEETKSSTKQATKEAPKTTEKAAEKTKTAQDAEKGTSSTAKKEDGTLKKAAKFYAKNPKALGWHSAFALGTYGLVSGEGIVKPLLYLFGGKNASENGLGGMLGQAVAGDKAPELYNKVTDAAGAVVDEGVNLYQTGKDSVSDVVDEGIEWYQHGMRYIGNGMTNNHQGGYSDPTTEAYPNPYQPSYPNNQQGYGQDGMLNNVMDGMSRAVNEVSGGSVTKMNILSLAIASYMMFGRYGWLGKAASLLLGGMTLKNINHRQAGYQQMPLQQQQPRQDYQQAPTPNSYLQPAFNTQPANVLQDAEEDIVQRPRGMRL